MNSSRHPLPILAAIVITLAPVAMAGPYAPEAGLPGSTAIASDDPSIVAWATGWQDYLPGPEVSSSFQTPDKALGAAAPPAEADAFDIVSLGQGGSIVLTFARPITDGPGADFAVFENSNVQGFLELAFVEVSSDGVHYVRFPNDSLTASPVGPFANLVDPTEVDGFAGKYTLAQGTPFDLADLPPDGNLDPRAISHVRLVDVIGNGSVTDSSGDIIYDPYPTAISAGFDLDAVGVIHEARPRYPVAATIELAPTGWVLRWDSATTRTYLVESSDNLRDWSLLQTLAGTGSSLSVALPTPPTIRYYRVSGEPIGAGD